MYKQKSVPEKTAFRMMATDGNAALRFPLAKTFCKVILLTTILFQTLLTAGCWDNRELFEISIITALGIDLAEDRNVVLTIQVLKPGAVQAGMDGGDGGSKAFVVYSAQGKTVLEAHNNLLLTINREPYYGHLQLIVVGEGLEKARLMRYLDFFERYPEMNRQAMMLTAQGTRAENVLRAESEMNDIPAVHLRQIVENAEFTGKIKPLSLHDLISFINLEGRHPVMSAIEFKTQSDKSSISDIQIMGSAVLQNDLLVGFIDTDQTRSVLIVRGVAENMILTVPHPDDPDSMVSIDIADCITEKEIHLRDGKPVASIQVKMTGLIGEVQDKGTSLEIATNERIQRKLKEKVTEEINEIIKLAQTDFRVDFLGIGELVYRKMPDYWKQVKNGWNNTFADMQIEVAVEVDLQRPGLITDPSKVK